MGVVRLLLALAVVSAHAGKLFNLPFIGGDTSVECFFIISGFYMALVLSTKYTEPNRYGRFIIARVLRLFPAYVFIAVLSVIWAWISFHYNLSGNAAGGGLFVLTKGAWPSLVCLIVVNALILGQDVIMFSAIDPENGQLYFTKNFTHEPSPAFSCLLIPQAWSLSLELLFYALAPFLTRLPVWVISLLAGGSLLLRGVMLKVWRLDFDPWTYRFFPTELVFFLAGMLTYRAYTWLELREQNLKIASFALWGLLVLAILTQRAWPLPHHRGLFFVFFAAALPFVFLAFRENRIDRIIGEISYPLYLVHLLVWSILGSLNAAEPHAVAAISIAAAALILFFVELPAEHLRRRLVEKVPPQKRAAPLA